jgi:phosphoribosylformylglycinamidine synthase
VGLIEDVNKTTTVAFKKEGQTIIRIGDMEGHLGASVFAEEILGMTKEGYAPPKVDLALEKKNGEFVAFAIDQGWITACHDVSEGGQLVTIAEMAIAGNIGATLDISTDVARAFGEDQARYIITVPNEYAERILTRAPEQGVSAIAIGETGGDAINIGAASIKLNELRESYEGTLPNFMGIPV